MEDTGGGASPLRATSAPAAAPVAPPLMARAFSAPEQSDTGAPVPRTFDPLDRMAGEEDRAAAEEDHPRPRAQRSQSMLSLRTLRATQLHARVLAARGGATSGAMALRDLGLGVPRAAAAASKTATTRPPLLEKMASVFSRSSSSRSSSNPSLLDTVAEGVCKETGAESGLDSPRPASESNFWGGGVRHDEPTSAASNSEADAADGLVSRPAAESSSFLPIDLDAVFGNTPDYGTSNPVVAGQSGPSGHRNLELLDLARAGKLALLVNDRTAWVTMLACIRGYDATALSSVSHFWQERLARPSLARPLWAYYFRNEFPDADRSEAYGAVTTDQRRLWREVPNLFHFVTVAMRGAEQNVHVVPTTTSADRSKRKPMRSLFIKEHNDRNERRREAVMEERRVKVRTRVKAKRLCQRRCIVHPVLCVGSCGCLALPVPLLALTNVLLMIQASVVEDAPQGSAAKEWSAGGYGAALWIWPAALIGLCWCMAFTCFTFHSIMSFCQPKRNDDPTIHSVEHNRTASQLLHHGQEHMALPQLAWRGMWPDNASCCFDSCGIRRWCFWTNEYNDLPCLQSGNFGQENVPWYHQTWNQHYSNTWNVNGCMQDALHFISSPKSLPPICACIGMLSLLLAPIVICIGTALEASDSMPTSLWWLFFLPLWIACACCMVAPLCASLGEDSCKSCMVDFMITAIICAAVGFPCILSLLAGISLSLPEGMAIPPWGVMMPIFVWAAIFLVLLALVWCFALAVMPIVFCIRNDCTCDADYTLALCKGDGEEKAIWSLVNFGPPLAVCCLVGPLVGTAVLATLRYTPGYEIPSWSIGLPILLLLCIIEVPLCFVAACLCKENCESTEGSKKGYAGVLAGNCARRNPCCPAFYAVERNGGIHDFKVYLDEEGV